MNLLCPHCQQMLQVPDQQAGQTAKCQLCGGTFTVPSLAPAPAPPPPPPVSPPPVTPAPASFQASTPPAGGPTTAPAGQAGTFSTTAPAPPAPGPTSPWLEQPAGTEAGTPAPEPHAPGAPPPTPPAGYTRTRTLWVSPRVVPWVAPACLGIIFILTFFNWVGMYPGRSGVETQNGWQAAFGSYSRDRVFWAMPEGQRLSQSKDPDRREPIDPSASVLLILWLLLFLLALLLAIASAVVPRLNVQLPPQVKPLWPWRTALVGLLAALAFLLLLGEMVTGFPLEKEVVSRITEKSQPVNPNTDKPDEVREKELRKGMAIDAYHLERTAAFDLVVLLNLVAVIGLALEIWLERRGATRPLPRVDLVS